MDNSDDNFLPDWFSPPGDTISTILDEKDISIESFANQIGFDLEKTYRLLEGQEVIDEKLANKLSQFLGSTAKFWLKREEHYRQDYLRISKDETQ